MKKESTEHNNKTPEQGLENAGLGKIKPRQLEESPNSVKNKEEKSNYKGGPENHPGKGL